MTDEQQARRAFMTVLRKNGRGNRDPNLEPVILKSPNWSARYAYYCVGGRWKEAEALITGDPRVAYDYAYNVRGPFPEAEKMIARDADCAYRYAKYILHDRFPAGEKSIARDPESAARYASDVIEGRWERAEKAIMADSRWMLHYAKKAIRGQLPEVMHSAMIMNSFANDPYAKKYGSTKKFMKT